MTLKKYLIIMAFMTLACLAAWTGVLFLIDPEKTNWIGFLLFYAALFASLAGTGAVLGFLSRFVILKKELAFRLVKEAFRQSFLFAILIVASLLLLSKGVFSLLNLFFLVTALTVLEFFWLSYNRSE